MPQRATIKTIAKAVGVAVNTVSLALQDSSLVASGTKQRVLEEAARQGYQRDVLAQALRSGRSHTIALVFGDVANPLFAMKIKLLSQAFRMHDYQVFILDTDENPQQELAAMRVATQRKADGVVVCPCQQGREALELLHRAQIPCLLLGREFDTLAEDTVVWDDREGGRLATRHLLGLGCRRILHLTARSDISSARQRRLGYEDALGEAGLAVEEGLIREVSPLGEGVTEALQAVTTPFDGVFAFNDLLAWQAMSRVPDLPFVGFDHIRAQICVPVSMPSIAADVHAEAALAVELLLARMADSQRPPERHVLPVRLVEAGK
ncbi:MAG: LacI family DNA-binding transcriptional regulator [Clostridia bacterium]